MRRPATHFVTVQNRLTSIYLRKTLIYVPYRLLVVTQAPYHTVKVLQESKERPYETNIFRNSFEQIDINISPKTLIYIQNRLSFSPMCYITQWKWLPSPEKSPRNILMRRPEAYFATVFNRLTSIKKHWFVYKTCYYLSPMCYITQWKWLPCHEKIRRTGMSCELISALGNHISNII